MGEYWKAIKGFEGLYEVSNRGEVRRLRYKNRMTDKLLDPPQIITSDYKSNRYCQVQLSKDGKRFRPRVHQLVLAAFVGPCPSGMQAAHYDGNSRNNHVGNLRWATPAENTADRIRHGNVTAGETNFNAKLTAAAVRDIRARRKAGWKLEELAAAFRVDQSAIHKVVSGKRWKHVI